MKPDVRVFRDVNELSRQLAEATVRIINETVQTNGSVSLALSGGNTPRTLYRILSSQFRDQIPWKHVHVFWGDERCVPLDDPHSNYRMAWETLLDAVPCPPEHVHPMRTQLWAPDVAAWDYEKTLRNHFSKDWPRFNLVFLGLGEEGHTASLFPESPALAETKRWVVAVDAPVEPHLRLTLTLPALTHAANAYFLVTGSNKAQALPHILLGSPDPKHYPASGVRLAQGTVIWWLDREAAALVVNRGGDTA
ncbi:MAG TPA: 6-phosphogluconolactonase [Nitrospira sp.]|nr:6-phosphogluconolactonase [Nitrospira sp.]